MDRKSNKRTLSKKIRDKYRLVIYNDNTFEEVLQFRLSRLNLFVLIGFATLILIIGITLLIAFTPIREFIPGYPSGEEQRNMIQNALKLDSLQQEIALKDQYLTNINNILQENIPSDKSLKNAPPSNSKAVDFTPSKSDSILRHQIEKEEKYNISLLGDQNEQQHLYSIHFFKPLNGVVTNAFNFSNNHFGTDIVANSNEVVKATLDGVVTMSTWTLETGFIIQIQHDNDLISIYKHNANLLKQTGDHVKAGEAIAIVGNSGELSTGPHLHFELWYKGKPLNVEDYISF